MVGLSLDRGRKNILFVVVVVHYFLGDSVSYGSDCFLS